MIVQADAFRYAHQTGAPIRAASRDTAKDVFTPSEPLPQTLSARDAMALLAVKDEVFPPVQAELVLPGPDGPLTVTKVPTRPSVAGRALAIEDSQVFLERDGTRNYIRRVDSKGTMVFSEEFSQGFNVKWKGHDGDRLYVQLHADRQRPMGDNLFALDVKTGKVLASTEVPPDDMVTVAPGGGVFTVGSGLRKLDPHLQPVGQQPSKVHPYKARAVGNGSTVIHNQRQGGAVAVIDAHGRELFHRETDEYDSPLLSGTDLWLIDNGSALQVDTVTGRARNLPAPGASAVLPRADGSYVTVSGDKYRFGHPSVELRGPDGGLRARVTVDRAGGLEQVHEDQEAGEVLLVVRHDNKEQSLYRLPLDGHSQRAERLLTLPPAAPRYFTRMIPARLEDGRYAVFTPESVKILGGREYASAAEAARDLGPAFSVTSRWWQGSTERSFLNEAELMGEVARVFPYAVPNDPTLPLSHSDNCINVVRPGGTLEEPRTASPLPLETTREYPDGHRLVLKYMDSYDHQYVNFGREGASRSTTVELPVGVHCTAMLPAVVGQDHKAVVGTDEGLVYYADMAVRNHSVFVAPHVFDLGAPVAEIRQLEDGRIQALGEGGEVLTIDPRLHLAFSLSQLRERSQPGAEIELGPDGVQIGGIFLPIEG